MGINRSDGGQFKLNYGGNVGSATHFVMTPSGNVGIGTMSPSHKLEVAGHVKARGFTTGDIVFQKDGQKLW